MFIVARAKSRSTNIQRSDVQQDNTLRTDRNTNIENNVSQRNHNHQLMLSPRGSNHA